MKHAFMVHQSMLIMVMHIFKQFLKKENSFFFILLKNTNLFFEENKFNFFTEGKLLMHSSNIFQACFVIWLAWTYSRSGIKLN